MTKLDIPFLIKAIQNRTPILIVYDGKTRIVEPHCLGHEHLRAYQTWPEEGWKLFKLAKAEQPGPFDIRPDYKEGDSAMKSGIVAQIKRL